MAIPSASLLNEEAIPEIIKVQPPLIFESYGLSEEDLKKNTSFGQMYWYSSVPFHLAQFDASAFVIESGIVFDPNTKKVRESTVYQVIDRESHIERATPDDGYKVSAWWSTVVEQNTWRKFNFGFPVVANWHRYCHVYYHFLVEFLFSAWRVGSDPQQSWQRPMVISNGISPYQWGALKALNIHSNIASLPANAVLCGDVIIPSALHAKTWVHPEVADFGNHCRRLFSPSNPLAPEKIYISRSRASARRMTNEKELEVVLSDAGFTIVTLEGLSFEEQVCLFSHAKVIVAPHGSGLANIIFAPAGCAVLELTSFGFAGRWPLHDGSFRRLSHVCGHRYGLITFGNDPSSQSWQTDVGIVRRAVKSLCQ